MKLSACVWIEQDGKVVLTTRRNSTLVSMPGGKVDPSDNSVAAAAVREVFEETGIVLSPESLVKVYADVCGDDSTNNIFMVSTFFIQVSDLEIPGGSEPDITTMWGDPALLVENSPFSEYNIAAIAAIEAHKQKKCHP